MTIRSVTSRNFASKTLFALVLSGLFVLSAPHSKPFASPGDDGVDGADIPGRS